MTAMHPDSGVPPNEARNSLPNDVEASVHCDELWYSTSRCTPRFDPAAANAMLAELINLINKGEVVYDCNRLDQVQFAVRYIAQRGLTTGTRLQGGPLDYYCALDPQCTRYNDYLTLIVVPVIDNTGAVRINTDNLGLVPLLRNDGQQLEAGDLRTNIPTLISFYSGYWYLCGLAASQICDIMTGCLPCDFEPLGAACTVETLVIETDAVGCRKIKRYNEGAATLAFWDTKTVWPTPNGMSRPANPTDLNSFYDIYTLYNDVIAGTVNESKLTDNLLVQGTLTVSCDTYVELHIEATTVFDPPANYAGSACVVRVDGVFRYDGGLLHRLGDWTNYDNRVVGVCTEHLTTGTHTFQIYVAGFFVGRPAAQVYVVVNAQGTSACGVSVKTALR